MKHGAQRPDISRRVRRATNGRLTKVCTVTFWPRENGYLLAMNRDEKRTRPRGLPPSRHRTHAGYVAHPREPGGGTWIALNDQNATFALINWYAIQSQSVEKAISRGQVVLAARDAREPADIERTWNAETLEVNRQPALQNPLRLESILPFRLIAIFPSERLVREWRWDQRLLTRVSHTWVPQQWISSGFDEPAAQKIRDSVFQQRRTDANAGTAEWLRSLHASHDSEAGPFSTCMHRPDAVTVSYTEIQMLGSEGRMFYRDGSPCSASEPVSEISL